jgi:hypothetical protein
METRVVEKESVIHQLTREMDDARVQLEEKTRSLQDLHEMKIEIETMRNELEESRRRAENADVREKQLSEELLAANVKVNASCR